MKNKSKKLVVVLVILILLAMAVAYAAVSQTLTITGTAKVSADVSQVIITGITPAADNATTGGTDTTAPSYTDTTATFDVTLAQPGAYAIYTVKIENKGNSDADLSQIQYFLGATAEGTASDLQTINDEEPSGIKFEVQEPDSDKLIAGDSTTVTVKAYWDENTLNVAKDASKTMTMSLLYEVAEN